MNDFVGMITKQCWICGKKHEEIIINKFLKSVDKYDGKTFCEQCEECSSIISQGGVFLIEIDPSKTPGSAGDNIKPEDAYRTGRYVAMKREAVNRIFNVRSNSPVMFIDPEVSEQLGLFKENG